MGVGQGRGSGQIGQDGEYKDFNDLIKEGIKKSKPLQKIPPIKDGKRVYLNDWGQIHKIEYFDGNRNKVKDELYFGGPTPRVVGHFDQNGKRQIKEDHFLDNGKPYRAIEWIFDKKGKHIKTIYRDFLNGSVDTIFFNNKGIRVLVVTTKPDKPKVVTYYDNTGDNVVKKITYGTDGKKLATIFFNKNGMKSMKIVYGKDGKPWQTIWYDNEGKTKKVEFHNLEKEKDVKSTKGQDSELKKLKDIFGGSEGGKPGKKPVKSRPQASADIPDLDEFISQGGVRDPRIDGPLLLEGEYNRDVFDNTFDPAMDPDLGQAMEVDVGQILEGGGGSTEIDPPTIIPLDEPVSMETIQPESTMPAPPQPNMEMPVEDSNGGGGEMHMVDPPKTIIDVTTSGQ